MRKAASFGSAAQSVPTPAKDRPQLRREATSCGRYTPSQKGASPGREVGAGFHDADDLAAAPGLCNWGNLLQIPSVVDSKGFGCLGIRSQQPIASIGTVEVFKAPIPSMWANAVGGSINFSSKGAFETRGRRISIQAGTNVDGHDYFGQFAGPG